MSDRTPGEHAIWVIEKDEKGALAYVEGFSTAPTPEGSLYHRNGEGQYGWFCFEPDDDDMVRRELTTLGFTDEQIAAAIDAAVVERLDLAAFHDRQVAAYAVSPPCTPFTVARARSRVRRLIDRITRRRRWK